MMLLLVIVLLVLFILLIGFSKSPKFKGMFSEMIINLILNFLDSTRYQLLKNVTLPCDDGTTQIDHIIVSVYGIFVIETKNIKGWIFASEHQKKWTKTSFGRKYSFQNPLHQNYKHVKTLQTLLGLKEDELISIVVFTAEAEFKKGMPKNVIYPRGLLRLIKNYNKTLFTPVEMFKMKDIIENSRLAVSLETDRQHVQNLRVKKGKQKNLICPRCGNGLVMRKAKKGKNIGNTFYGCSSYPKCRYIEDKDNT